MRTVLVVRTEQHADEPAVREVNTLAFGRGGEADLVDALRAVGKGEVSLVAELAGRVVGHILFSKVQVEPEESGSAPSATARLLGLAPMAVLPEFQRRGIGSLLVRDGLDACRAAGWGAVVVLGHPGYYPRFGFVPAHEFNLRCTYDAPPEAFMALELRSGALRGIGGVARYAPEFDGV